jgi:hypothetical protein
MYLPGAIRVMLKAELSACKFLRAKKGRYEWICSSRAVLGGSGEGLSSGFVSTLAVTDLRRGLCHPQADRKLDVDFASYRVLTSIVPSPA